MSVTISVRVEDHVLEDINRMGYKPGEYMKRVLIRDLRRMKSKKALSWLKENRIESVAGSSRELIRKDRDSR